MRASKQVTVNIKGSPWIIKLFTKKQYEKLHGCDSGGITISKDKQIHLIKTELIPENVRHEIFHAFVEESNTASSNLDADQMEELCATIMGCHGIKIITLADYILTQFLI